VICEIVLCTPVLHTETQV